MKTAYISHLTTQFSPTGTNTTTINAAVHQSDSKTAQSAWKSAGQFSVYLLASSNKPEKRGWRRRLTTNSLDLFGREHRAPIFALDKKRKIPSADTLLQVREANFLGASLARRIKLRIKPRQDLLSIYKKILLSELLVVACPFSDGWFLSLNVLVYVYS
jgi:hypothetical protein